MLTCLPERTPGRSAIARRSLSGSLQQGCTSLMQHAAWEARPLLPFLQPSKQPSLPGVVFYEMVLCS